jgi:hypothetical protein
MKSNKFIQVSYSHDLTKNLVQIRPREVHIGLIDE